MGMIRIYEQKCKNPKKKPGWQKEAAEYEAWKKRMDSMTLFNPAAKPKTKYTPTKIDPVVRGPVIDKDRIATGRNSRIEMVSGGTKKVARPELMYKDNPEMLERELKAREIKHNAVPAYNKGGAQFVTQEELANQLRGNKRRP